MRLDPELARAILKAVGNAPANREPDVQSIDGYTEDEFVEHVELLNEAGLLNARLLRTATGQGRIYAVAITRLTYAENEFLAVAENDTLWAKAKHKVLASGAAVTIATLKIALSELVKHALNTPG
jgi:hypothetical protein